MSATVLCVEPDRRPATLALALEEGEVFHVALLEPDEAGPHGVLRATALRGPDEALPAGAEPLIEAVVARSPTGGHLGIRVLACSGRRPIEVVRAEGRSRLSQGMELRGTTRAEILLDDMQRIELHLGVTANVASGAGVAVSGSGTHRSQALATTSGALWLLPTVWALLTQFTDQIVVSARALLKRWGVTPRMAATLTALFFIALLNVGMWYANASALDVATLQADQASSARDAADAAAAAALQGEQSCLADRAVLVARTQEDEAERRLRVEAALALTASRATAIAVGGRRLGSDAVLAFDALQRDSLVEAVLAQMARTGEAPREAATCLAQAPLLGSDLPRYALLWHPDPALSCPSGYLAVRGGTTLAGRWGLSPRVASAFLEGGAPAAQAAADPRLEDRAAARATLAGLRAVQTALLTHRTGQAAPVAPSQARLWALAIYAAIDALPSPADGALDAPPIDCVGQLLDQAVARRDARAPGEPVLPDIAAISLGETALPLVPSPSCPWPQDVLRDSATTTLSAVARLAWADDIGG